MACDRVKPCNNELPEDCLPRPLSSSKEGTDWAEYCNSFGPTKAGSSLMMIWDCRLYRNSPMLDRFDSWFKLFARYDVEETQESATVLRF